MENCNEIIINSPPKMIVSAYKPALNKINSLLIKMIELGPNDSINYKCAFGMIEKIIKQYRIPYNIYASGILAPATILCSLVKWGMERNSYSLINARGGFDSIFYDTDGIVQWYTLLHKGLTIKQTPDSYPDYKAIEYIFANNQFSSIEKILLIDKAFSYFNPNEPNPELWPNDPKVMNIVTMPPGDRARELARQLFAAPNNREVITDIADELIELYKDFLKDK